MIIGIDPGKSGGVAAVHNGAFIDGIRTPILKHGKRDLVGTAALDDWVDSLDEPIPYLRFMIEQVSAMPGQGVASMFNFGRHTGAVEGWALSYSHSVRWVTPQKWKRSYGLSASKQASLDRAKLEFGENKLWGVLANDGIAEAALIALWAERNP